MLGGGTGTAGHANGFWEDFRGRRAYFRSIIFDQKSIKKVIKIQHEFLIVFDRVGGPSWRLWGGQNRPKMSQVGLKTALETIFVEKSECSRKALKSNEKSIKMTSRAVRK